MTIKHQEQVKLELAAIQLVNLVDKTVGGMLSAHEIVIYGSTERKREKIYKTLERYGYRWDEDHWVLTIPAWITELVADAWVRHEITRD